VGEKRTTDRVGWIFVGKWRGQTDDLMLLYFPAIEPEAERRCAGLAKHLSVDIFKFAIRRQTAVSPTVAD
jgi:hypothetical protein